MCVPAHDDRDFEFAKKFDIPIIQVIAKDGKEIENMTEAYTEAVGTMINSGEWNGMESSVLKKEAPHIIEEKGFGKATVNYKLRDWVFSRQRYWGNQFQLFIVLTVVLYRYLKISYHYYYLMLNLMSQQVQVNHHLQQLMNG